MPAGAPCPVSTEVQQPDPRLAPLLGTGPARVAGLEPGTVLTYESPELVGNWVDRTWGGQDPPQPELHLNTGSYEGQSGGWRDYPSFTRVRTPGCYAYQIDTAAGTWSIVFTARGPVV
jgi:hypothetical protein